MADTIQSVRDEIRRERERLNELEHKLDLISQTHNKMLDVMQGDTAWKRKGVIDQLAELATFMDTIKDFDFLQMKTFATEYNEFKRHFLWLCGGIVALIGLVGTITSNLDKIQNLFHR